MTDAADDFDALFDEVSAQRTENIVPPSPTAKPANLQPVQSGIVDTSEILADKPMFERLGGIVRLLHDSLRELGYDRSLSNVATQITDAQDRLKYIASLTEQAANKVLNTIDIGMPAQDILAKKAKEMESRWALLFDGKLSIDEFKTLAGDSKKFAATVTESTEAEKARLLEIMMAQDFQDITGQLIKKIVVITHTAEHELAQLLRDNAPHEMKAAIAAAEHKPAELTSEELMSGPSVPSSAMEQDDVDSLLADLGF
jgi:chemotaxis protein CheZ